MGFGIVYVLISVGLRVGSSDFVLLVGVWIWLCRVTVGVFDYIGGPVFCG